MKHKLKVFKQFAQKTGVTISLLVTAFSTTLLIVSLIGIKLKSRDFETLAILSLTIEFVYGIAFSFLILKRKEEYLHLLPFVILNWFIGCFCLNTFIPVFQDLPVWVYLTTFTFCLSNFFIYKNEEDNLNSFLLFFINGASFGIIIYFVIYLIPLTPISIVAILALGMGFYGLVPLVVLIIHTLTILRYLQRNRLYFQSFSAGISIVFIVLLVFTVGLTIESRKIANTARIKSFHNEEDLPAYIFVSQNLKPNFFNEILLKKDIVYMAPDDFFSFNNFDSLGIKQFNQRKINNPFISIAYLFCEDLGLSNDDKINILRSNFDKRLETEEQLWSGEDTFTKNIKEDVKIYPDSRLAYTEITMDIACKKESWQNQEAIYSFQLPEGSVATSLSLWVNGIERKGILTTKEKAKAAYNQIVGVEYRDPSLMQWKEGNRVVVRVFPVSYKTPRTFKCGFTTPLKVEDNEMKYQSLSIKGPNIANAKTISRIQITGNTKIETSKDFELKNGFYLNQSKGLDDWQADMPLNKINSSSFVWKDKIYEVKDIQKTVIRFTPSEIILDLNSNWTNRQIESFVNLNQKNIYVFVNGEKTAINKENFKAIQLDFEDFHYSLLPLYKLAQNSLIITKSGTFSANFEDIEDSEYLKKIKSSTKQRNLKVINIGADITPFWQTVKEQKYVDYFQTSLKNSLRMIEKHQFVQFKTDTNSVNIEPAHISIQENPKSNFSKNNGPNHIYRMYAFGKVLDEQVKIQNAYLSQKHESVSQDTTSVTAISVDEFRKEKIKNQNDSLVYNKYVNLAKDANIVTPISSLIVLETDDDYKKNGIEKNVNTLGNASINNDGAVPEPHEWLLIIIGLSTLLWYYRKNKKQTV
ncbi:XrtN system VIT domain-containing protein [Flavobacterium aquidurense]|uniref:XrtN system VIT domain-containing protein n=1 Tax=Flavobacterium aquidurense TaxID=362413 RepID=UPI0028626E9B|nr:XrtN system VIT domain-containing protein [Flavobacterium aquidurense]MDR7372739.1 XrtN system VIT domain protein [Flavobacterium aquidurense]